MKAKTRIAAWNVRTLYQAGKVTQVAKEMNRYNFEILGISECRSGLTSLATGHRIIYLGHASEAYEHTERVGIMMKEESAKSLIEFEPASPKIITARFNSKERKVTMIQCYRLPSCFFWHARKGRGLHEEVLKMLNCGTVCQFRSIFHTKSDTI